jgi:hypothetical protein
MEDRIQGGIVRMALRPADLVGCYGGGDLEAHLWM